MVEIPGHTPEIARLIEASDASRARLGREVAVLRQRLDAPAKVVRSVRAFPLRWVGGALATGVASVWLLRRKPAPTARRKSKGPAGLLLSLAIAAAKPALKSWATKQAKRLLIEQLSRVSKPTPDNLPADSGFQIRR
ncbi:MAG: hypothetical protein J0M04_19315 [Verrucomicrobia bacterium]|nr:hypothetical protein [Verrucomicrobiota bacterium]